VVVPTCQGASATGGIGIAIGVIGTGIGDVTGTGRIVIVEEIQTRGAIETGAAPAQIHPRRLVRVRIPIAQLTAAVGSTTAHPVCQGPRRGRLPDMVVIGIGMGGSGVAYKRRGGPTAAAHLTIGTAGRESLGARRKRRPRRWRLSMWTWMQVLVQKKWR